MASGRPIVLMASGEAADIVHRHQAGIVVAPADRSSLVQAIREMRQHPETAARFAANARAAAVEHFDRTEIASSFIEYLRSGTRESADAVEAPCEVGTR